MTVIEHDNPGTYIDLSGEETVRPASSIAATVAVAQVADWGPLGVDEIQSFQTFGEAEQALGNSPTAARRAILSNFNGPGVPGYPAAGEVKFFRMATGDAEKATKSLMNTAGTPAAALKVDAKYTGERGNRLSLTVEESPADAALDQLRVLYDGRTVERFVYTPTDINGLAAAINAKNSPWVTATALVNSVALAEVADSALTGGDNGGTLTGTEWAAAIQGLEFEEFTIFDAHGLTDTGIQATLYAWQESLAAENRPIFLVIGGLGNETLSEAITRAGNNAAEHVIQVGVGSYYDEFLDEVVTSSQLTSRIAGALAGAGEGTSLTGMPIAGLSAVAGGGVASDELVTAWENGVTTFRRTTRTDTKLIINKGVTTFVDKTDPNKPYELFSDPRIVRVADLFLRRMKNWGDETIVGPTRVIEPTKATVRQFGNDQIKALIDDGLILAGTDETDAPFFRIIDNPGEQFDDAIVFEFGWKFVRTTNFLIGSGKVR